MPDRREGRFNWIASADALPMLRRAEIFCSLRTVTCTARKQGWSVIETLMKPSDQLITEMRLG